MAIPKVILVGLSDGIALRDSDCDLLGLDEGADNGDAVGPAS
jgi:hypothetical protein